MATSTSARRVLTSPDPSRSGSIVVEDEVAPIVVRPGVAIHRIWGSDQVGILGQSESPAAIPDSFFPRAGGARAVLITLAPSEDTDGQALHATDTVDVAVVVAGRLTLELDGGAIVELGPGETLVQHGTNHRWRNAGTEPASMVVFVVGTEPRPRSEV